MHEVLQRIGELKVVPVISIEDASHASGLADALQAGGLPIAEITFRTDAAESAIRALCARGDLLVGAGTVLNVETAQRAADAGARFVVSPGLNPKVVEWCVRNKLPILPGAITPTEIEMALDQGVEVIKFFPSEPMGGIKTIQLLSGPYGMIRFVPTGGIGPENLESYLRLPRVLACGGSWMASKELIAARQFDKIKELTRQAVERAARARLPAA
jgi:2-dehydro-3-deoxyphosphogluconate aldolase / (4S)-4-hydroxy-2-oxoglutarate aldolase